MKHETYPFPLPPVDDVGNECATDREATFWALQQAEESRQGMRAALAAARNYVGVHADQTTLALAAGYERRAAMMAFVQFARAYHVIACAWEGMDRDESAILVAELQRMEEESEVWSENASRVGQMVGLSAPLEACR